LRAQCKSSAEHNWHLACRRTGHPARRIVLRPIPSLPRSELPFRTARCSFYGSQDGRRYNGSPLGRGWGRVHRHTARPAAAVSLRRLVVYPVGNLRREDRGSVICARSKKFATNSGGPVSFCVCAGEISFGSHFLPNLTGCSNVRLIGRA